MSSVTRDDRQNLRRIIIGDHLTATRDFSSGLNLGGIGITKLYEIDPYFVRFPTQTLTGSVALPSDMEVYLDGQRIRTERLRPGEFELRDVLALGGAQNVQIVLRDSFGRVQQLELLAVFQRPAAPEGLAGIQLPPGRHTAPIRHQRATTMARRQGSCSTALA